MIAHDDFETLNTGQYLLPNIIKITLPDWQKGIYVPYTYVTLSHYSEHG
jgi:hypothetical protein